MSEYLDITGTIAFEMGKVQTFNVADALLPVSDLTELAELVDVDVNELPVANSIPALGADKSEVSVITIGASNINAFFGMKVPYWTYDMDAVANGGNGDGSFNLAEANTSSGRQGNNSCSCGTPIQLFQDV